ncbi:hypothetical protein [Streptomyces sp. LaBMicrA B280]|uniref:hypothetical protein n=1 Tax=Streptomyces sp. LaBMicrA B280 TaxID=3391001 RepID=UPI003BA7B0B4
MSGVAMAAERTAGSRTASGEEPVPVRLAAVYLPAPLPREGRIAFWDPAGEPLPPASADPEELTVVRRHGAGARRRQVPALGLPLAAALPLLVRSGRWTPTRSSSAVRSSRTSPTASACSSSR